MPTYTHYDALGRPIAIGDTVLTKGYSSTSFNCITTVETITAKNIRVSMKASYYKYNSTLGKYEHITQEGKRMYRHPLDCVVINEQLTYNHAAYPESYI